MKNILLRLLLLSTVVLSWSACSCWKNSCQQVQRTDSVAAHHSWQADSVLMQHSRYVLIRGDTVLVRDTLLRDRVRTVVRTDTIYQRQEVYIEKPVRYVPRFYKGCAAMVCMMLIGIVCWAIWRIKRNI